MDWPKIGEESVELMRGYLRVNTTNPPGRETVGTRFLAGVLVSLTGTAKVRNLSPPDTELYKSLADALRRRAPGVVVAPEIMVGFTDNWVFRRCGMHGYGFGPFVLEQDDWKRIHGNDERISVENLHAGARCYTEMLLDMAAA